MPAICIYTNAQTASKFASDKQIVYCVKSLQIFISADFHCGTSFSCIQNFSSRIYLQNSTQLFKVSAIKILTVNKYTAACSLRNNVF